MKNKVALIFGGEGKEHEVSEASAQNLASLIDTNLYDLMLIGITKSGEWYIYDGPIRQIKGGAWQKDKSSLTKTFPVKMGERSGFLCDGRIISVCCAIPCLHGDFGEDGIIQGALAAAHIKYIGQDIYGSAATSDKAMTKLIAQHLKIPTAKWLTLTESNPALAKELAEKNLNYPMFLKPTRYGSSYGAHPVRCDKDFISAYSDAYAFGNRVLIEELVPINYELECAFLQADRILLAPYGKITTDGIFYGYEEKYKLKNAVRTQADTGGISSDIKSLILDYSERLIRFLGLKHLSRIDFFVTERGEIYFNEINAFPGMTDTSLYPALTETLGFKRGEFINLLIKEASR